MGDRLDGASLFFLTLLSLIAGAAVSASSVVENPAATFHYHEKYSRHCTVLSRRYFPSALETSWRNATRQWQEARNGNCKDIEPYCALLKETWPQIEKMLTYIDVLMKSTSCLSTAADADSVLSHFVVQLQCGQQLVTRKEHIESLVAALRHPLAVPCPPKFGLPPVPSGGLFNLGHILLSTGSGQAHAKTKFYFDAGAGIGFRANSDQYWMVESYAARGISFDRIFFWEGRSAAGSAPFADFPPELFHATSFFNIPVSSDLNDGRHPVDILGRLARTDDFVSFKLDIDRPDIEDVILKAITNEDGVTRPGGHKVTFASLIDELFFEHHFNFEPMTACCWQVVFDDNSDLADSFTLFIRLRELGIRSHYWV